MRLHDKDVPAHAWFITCPFPIQRREKSGITHIHLDFGTCLRHGDTLIAHNYFLGTDHSQDPDYSQERNPLLALVLVWKQLQFVAKLLSVKIRAVKFTIVMTVSDDSRHETVDAEEGEKFREWNKERQNRKRKHAISSSSNPSDSKIANEDILQVQAEEESHTKHRPI